MSVDATTPRRYDEGEGRKKHVGKSTTATIEFDQGDPKKWIGKCPNSESLPGDVRARLLNEAIEAPNGDFELSVPKRLYVVHEGAIYRAETTERGLSYHAYPYKGKLSGKLLTRLEEMAQEKGCAEGFRDWVKNFIERHGERR